MKRIIKQANHENNRKHRGQILGRALDELRQWVHIKYDKVIKELTHIKDTETIHIYNDNMDDVKISQDYNNEILKRKDSLVNLPNFQGVNYWFNDINTNEIINNDEKLRYFENKIIEEDQSDKSVMTTIIESSNESSRFSENNDIVLPQNTNENNTEQKYNEAIIDDSHSIISGLSHNNNKIDVGRGRLYSVDGPKMQYMTTPQKKIIKCNNDNILMDTPTSIYGKKSNAPEPPTPNRIQEFSPVMPRVFNNNNSISSDNKDNELYMDNNNAFSNNNAPKPMKNQSGNSNREYKPQS